MHTQAIFVNAAVHHVSRAARGGLSTFTANGIVVGLGSHPSITALSDQKRYMVEDALFMNPLSAHVWLDYMMLRPLEFVLVACPFETDEIETDTGTRFEIVNVTVLKVPIGEFVRKWRVPAGVLSQMQATALHAIRVHCANGGLLSGVAILSSRVSLEANAAVRMQCIARVHPARRTYATLRMYARMAARETAASMIALQWGARPLRIKLNVARVARIRLACALEMDSATTAAITDLLDDLAPDFAFEIEKDCVGGFPAAPDWRNIKLSPRDDGMRQEAISYTRSNPKLQDVQVLSLNGNVFATTLPYDVIGSPPLGKPLSCVDSAEWNSVCVSQLRLDGFVRESKLYPDGGVPFDVLDPTYHTLMAFDADGHLVGVITIQLATMTSVVSSDANATMPLIHVALIATHPKTQRQGVGTALYNTAIRACFENGVRNSSAYILTEAVSAGDGWRWWKRRVVQKTALAVILAIQLLVIINGEDGLSKGALPSGELLLA